ncbi:Thioredoxin [Carnobacterium iners]|uniref:Thioredoxin n=1 Tax=Carnobacterium iners TaxID=1073423 RepID=A0A1X7MRY7_9LACT|nr:thioredoxin domain-containing protein [Carnobacterium iners]SEK86140.1 Thioredoxin [Carnobacterium iners]SMH26806.1 Thioredoxin [Carnobacterium iners]
MDTSKIKAKEVETVYGLKIGDANAPVKVIEFINVSCPFCKKWHDDSKELLAKYVEEGKVQRIIKHYNKETPHLRKGNVVHRYLDYSTPEVALKEIDYFYEKQGEWGNLNSMDEIAAYVEEKRGLTIQPNEKEIASIIEEAVRANVELVPSVFIGDEVFDEHITVDELQILIENELNSANK